MRRILLIGSIAIRSSPITIGQLAQKLTFEVASVKPSPPIPRMEEFSLDRRAAGLAGGAQIVSGPRFFVLL